MKHILGTIDTGNPSGEKMTVIFNDATKQYILSSNMDHKEITLSKAEMDRLFEILDNIEKMK